MKEPAVPTTTPDEEVGVSENADNHTVVIEEQPPPPKWILPIIVISQFLGTIVWFAPNAVFPKLIVALNLNEGDFSYVTSITQVGFIAGTLVFAIFSVSDRLPPTQVFFVSSIMGALSNVAVIWAGGLVGILLLRFMTGFFLAGIYPVGMKIASDWFRPLGPALGLLVGALCVGSALPFLLQRIPQSWQALLIETSAGAVVAGVLMGCVVPDGPHRHPATRFQPMLILHLFRNPDFTAASFGYFGHLWEAYAFWAYLPVVWKQYAQSTPSAEGQLDLIVFAIIAIGALGCAVGGWMSPRYGSARIATLSLMASGLFCAISPVLYMLPFPLTLILYLLWGIAVAADSPQFSSLIAHAVCPKNRGSALTLSTCIGFAVTVGSDQLLGGVSFSSQYLYLLLLPGPVVGVLSMLSLVRKEINAMSTKTAGLDEMSAPETAGEVEEASSIGRSSQQEDIEAEGDML